jgi:F420-dependent oxidoreductase-like protein
MDATYPVGDAMLEGYTALGFLAAVTERVRLGLLVSGVTYRHPGVLAKIVATLSVLSSGRADLGIGAAWYEREHAGLGVPFPPLATRYELLEETLQICAQMWSGTIDRFDGRHHQLAETRCPPLPVDRPRVIIGGDGERRTLPLVARYADACNLYAESPAVVARKLELLTELCERIGRDPGAVRRTIIHVGDEIVDGDVDGFVDAMAAYAAVGVQQVSVIPDATRPSAWLSRLPEVVDRLAAIPVVDY